MPAYTLSQPYPAPHIEFLAMTAGGVRIRILNTAGGVEYETSLNGATWSALNTAMGSAGNLYVPSNVNSVKGDGSMTHGGHLQSKTWSGAA